MWTVLPIHETSTVATDSWMTFVATDTAASPGTMLTFTPAMKLFTLRRIEYEEDKKKVR